MADPLGAADLAQALSGLDGWQYDGSAIRRTVSLPGFLAAIRVVDRVAEAAEQMDHHPDIDIRWRTLTFACVTHSAGAVTDRDVTLASKIDEIVRDAKGRGES